MALMIAALRYFGSADIGGDCDGFKAVALQNNTAYGPVYKKNQTSRSCNDEISWVFTPHSDYFD